MAERIVQTRGVELCTEPFGDPADPPVLLIMGTGASMLWWEEGFCRLLAGGGRFVVRYDHRDTGRSVVYGVGHPEYTGADLVADAVGVLGAYRIPVAHLVGVSAGGAFAQLVALGHPDRVASLTLISTSPALSGDRMLPPPHAAFGEFVSTAAVEWADTGSVIDYLVAYSRMLARERSAHSTRRGYETWSVARSIAPGTSRLTRTTISSPRTRPPAERCHRSTLPP